MTTYADLLHAASRHVRDGHKLLRRDGFTSTGEAEQALVDFHGVLDAIAGHGRRLLMPAHSRRMRLDPRHVDLSPIERATAHLVIGIERLVGSERPHPALVRPSANPWGQAGTALRAATDLVALQFDALGRARTPEARAAMNPDAMETAHRELALVIRAVLADEEPLALRAIQRGISRSMATRFLPGLAALEGLARQVERCGDPAGPRGLVDLGQTWERVRTGEPVIELSDRLRHLRHLTWAAASQATGDDALVALRDVAVIGIAVHAHTAAFHGGRPMTAPSSANDAPVGTTTLVRRGRAWQTLHRHLSSFAALAPPTTPVRVHLVAISRLLPELAPLDATSSRAHVTDIATRRVGAALNNAVATMAQIGEDNATTFAALNHSRALYCLPACLDRELLSTYPDLAKARLRGHLAVAPLELRDAVIAGYDDVRTHPIHPLTRTHTAALTPTGIEEAFDAIHRT